MLIVVRVVQIQLFNASAGPQSCLVTSGHLVTSGQSDPHQKHMRIPCVNAAIYRACELQFLLGILTKASALLAGFSPLLFPFRS